MNTTYFLPNNRSTTRDVYRAGFRSGDRILIEGPFRAGEQIDAEIVGARSRGHAEEPFDAQTFGATEMIVKTDRGTFRIHLRKINRITKVAAR